MTWAIKMSGCIVLINSGKLYFQQNLQNLAMTIMHNNVQIEIDISH